MEDLVSLTPGFPVPSLVSLSHQEILPESIDLLADPWS
jgi:hypothetical protein